MILYVALSTVLEKDEDKGSKESVEFNEEIICFFWELIAADLKLVL